MFYYTFSVINTMFVPCTALLYDSTAATRTLKLSTTLLSISSGIHLISLLMMSSLVCGLFSQSVFQVPFQKIVRLVEILGVGWPGVVSLMRNESAPWEVMPEVFKCSVQEMRWHLISQSYSSKFVKTIHRQERTSSEEKSDGFYKKCSIELLLCFHTVPRCMERTQH